MCFHSHLIKPIVRGRKVNNPGHKIKVSIPSEQDSLVLANVASSGNG